MPDLSDTQAAVLSAAAQRKDGNVLPLPGSLRGGAQAKVVRALLTRGLVREQAIDNARRADLALNTIWRNEPDGPGVLLLITEAGLGAIGIEADTAAQAPDEAESTPAAADTPPETPAPAAGGGPRPGSRLGMLVSLLRRAEGAAMDEMTAATGWQPHSVRGALAGALKKKFGLTITSTKGRDEPRCYRITG